MKKTLLIGLTVLAMTGGGVALALGNSAQDRPAATASAQRQTTFAVENMTCATCPITVRKAMKGVAGVTAVNVDFAAKTARATYDPRRANAAQIAAASTDAGYPARAIQN
ncbi:MAG TPA: cation transporter [Rhizorhapis sp.]|uniref:heavy-metal-associated domain-containing protein n=1 Tax=Sphingopyxis sp. SCN 67-31 TaxID=1660142 RepID=UPI000A8292D7|nr:cation transporter [Sphingopyxis sp. SCN 67-31]